MATAKPSRTRKPASVKPSTAAIDRKAEAEAAGEGTEIRSQASEPETAQALIPNDHSGVNGVYDPIYDPKHLGTKKGDR